MSKVTSEKVILEKENLEDTSANLETVKNNLEVVSKKIEEVKNNLSLEKNVIEKIEGHISDIGEEIETTRQILVKFQDNKREQNIENILLNPQKIYEEFSQKYDDKLDNIPILGKININALRASLFFYIELIVIAVSFKIFDIFGIPDSYIGLLQLIIVIICLLLGNKFILKKILPNTSLYVGVVLVPILVQLNSNLEVERIRYLNMLFMIIMICPLLNNYFTFFSEKEKNDAKSCINEVFENLAILPNEHKLDILIKSIKQYDSSSFASIKKKIFFVVSTILVPLCIGYFEKVEKKDIDKKLEGIKAVLQGVSGNEYIIKGIIGIIFILFYIFICKWCYDKSINRKRDLYINTLKDIQFTLILREI